MRGTTLRQGVLAGGKQQSLFLRPRSRAHLERRRPIFTPCAFGQPSTAKVRDQPAGATTFDNKQSLGMTETVWDQHLIKQKYPPLDKDLHAEVVVIGGGISGATAAYNLQKEGKQVVLLEKRVRCGGQTGRTTAHLMTWNDDYYFLLEKEFGTDKTRLVADSHRKSVDWVEARVKEHKIDCSFQRVDGYLFEYKNTPIDSTKLQWELEACQRVGLADTEWVDLPGDASVGGIKRALKFVGSADFQPVHYVEGLLDAFVEMGGVIHEKTPVKWEGAGKMHALGYQVTADNVIMATDSPIHRNLAIHSRQSAHRSYVVGLKVPKGKVRKADYWDTSSPYHYIRIEDKGDYDVLVVGGEDHDVGQNPKQYKDNFKTLEDYARVRWTDAGEVVYKWSGQVYEPVDKLGLYGKDPLDSAGNVYVITGDSGQGMTGGTIGGIICTDLILGRPNPWIDIYAPNRIPNPLFDITSIMEEAKQNIEGFGKVVLPKFENPDKLQPGEGCVTQTGVATKAAVYKDEDGTVQAYTALCPHLGCLVEWNPKEKTFDCPCHGSQFDRNGKCFQGPAISDLEKMEL